MSDNKCQTCGNETVVVVGNSRERKPTVIMQHTDWKKFKGRRCKTMNCIMQFILINYEEEIKG